MAKIRALSIVVPLGLALLATASPARAYVVEALTSVPADEAADKETLEQAIRAAVADIATHAVAFTDRKSTRLNSSHLVISYAVFCLKKKKKKKRQLKVTTQQSILEPRSH